MTKDKRYEAIRHALVQIPGIGPAPPSGVTGGQNCRPLVAECFRAGREITDTDP